MRLFVDDVIYPDAQLREADGKRPNQEVLDKMAYVLITISSLNGRFNFFVLQREGASRDANGSRKALERTNIDGRYRDT